MRKQLKSFVAFVFVVLFLPLALLAQERTITGTVLADDNKTPLAGVTITVKGTQRKVQTDANGNFSIRVTQGEVLQFSYVGHESQEVNVGSSNTLGIRMKNNDGTLGEVVVTAMDIKRNPRELGYSVQKVDGDDIRESQRENFLNSLQGRVAGLTINQTSGVAGASSSIVLRGFNSLSMSNQPLFVVDGIIMDNQTIDENSDGGKGVGTIDRTGLTNNANRNSDYTNRIADINPNDIETITVLKGPEATALYGSQASSGAIVITTRKAKTNKLAVQYDNSFRWSKMTRLPEYFDEYSSGANGSASNVFRYFGPKYPIGTKLYDNVDAFFKTGFAQLHNIGADFGFKNSIFRVSGSFFDQAGVIPVNGLTRYNFRLSNTTKIGKYVEVIPSVAYIKSTNDKVLRGSGGYLMSLALWPSTNDINNYEDEDGDKIPVNGGSLNGEIDNPLFNVNKNKSRDETERYTASLGININPFDWLSVNGRFGYDGYDMAGYTRYHPMSYFITQAQLGLQDNFYRKFSGYNHTITATAKKKLGDFNLRLMAGTMWQDNETKMFSVSGNGYIDSIVNGTMYKSGQKLNDSNFDTYIPLPGDSNATRYASRTRLLRNNFGEYNVNVLRQSAFFGEFSVNWKNMIFFTYSHRFEESSTLPADNRKYNYPAGSVSVILSDLIPAIKGRTISFMKLRGSVAQTARLNTPYSTQSVYVNLLSSGAGQAYGFTNANPFLEPERQKTFELGTEIRLFNSRLSVDASYYNTLNTDQIIEAFRLSYATGYVLNTQNAGGTRNQGVEVSLNASIIRGKELSWDMGVNFARMWNKVTEMPANLSEYYIADTWVFANARGGITLGSPTTTITTYGYQRNNAGQILISPTSGLPLMDNTFRVHGDRNPDFVIGWNNRFRYRNWSLSFLWDLKVGGDIFNGTNMYLNTIGRSEMTANRYSPMVIDGVLADGNQNTANPTKNHIVIVPAYISDTYYNTPNSASPTSAFGTQTMPEEAFIENDVNWFKLRDITLSYTFPAKIYSRVKALKGLGLFATANDLFLITNYNGPDPAVNGNTAGTRGVGAFGFDFFTLPSPVSLNVGLRASF